MVGSWLLTKGDSLTDLTQKMPLPQPSCELRQRVVARPASRATKQEACCSRRVHEGHRAAGHLGRVQLLDQVQVGSVLIDERTKRLVVYRRIG